jgi:lipopolysaccharide/colanic/teichoic acid biosynthesis glycosyltransferase
VDADVRLQRLLDTDPAARLEWDRERKLRRDPRITRVGRFLRKSALDELPQLWNVFKGDMSLVGPRPVVEAELERYGDEADAYLMVRPGITGLWQVAGRNDVDYGRRVALDAWYVRHWSLWNDLVVLFMTLPALLSRRGAY